MPAKDLWRGSEASPVVLLDGLGPRLGFRALSHTLLPSHWNCWLSWRLRVGNGHGVPTRLSWRAPPHLIWPSRSRHVASTWPPHLAQGRHVASVQRSRWPITFREPSTLTMQVRHRSVISRSRLCGEKATVSDFCAITVTGPPNSHAHGGASRMCDSCLIRGNSGAVKCGIHHGTLASSVFSPRAACVAPRQLSLSVFGRSSSILIRGNSGAVMCQVRHPSWNQIGGILQSFLRARPV